MNILDDALKAANSIWKAAESMRISADIEAGMKIASDAVRQFENAIPREQLASLLATAATIQKELERRAEEEPRRRRLFGALAQQGWVGLENHLAADATDDLLNELDQNGPEWLEAEICSEFRHEAHRPLNNILVLWSSVPYLADRREIIEDAFRAHREGRYALSIPTLMPLVDGLAAEIVGSSARQPKQTFYVRDAARQYHADQQEAWSEALVLVVNEQIYGSYGSKAAAPPSVINRHGVLHGRIASYGSEGNSLRTILLIDVFARFAVQKLQSP